MASTIGCVAMKLYVFVPGNYLKELQCGIQTTHVLGEMISKYYRRSQFSEVINEWANKHKTIVLLNAINADGVKAVLSRLQLSAENAGVPFASFHEDARSFDGAITGCGFIATSEIAEEAQLDRDESVSPEIPEEWLDHWGAKSICATSLRDCGDYDEENLINIINSHNTLK